MLLSKYYFLLFILISISCNKSLVELPNDSIIKTTTKKTIELPEKTKNLDDFIVKGCRLLKKITGDLNSDNKDDAVLVISKSKKLLNNENNETNANNDVDLTNDESAELLLVIVLQNQNGEFLLDSISNKALLQSLNYLQDFSGEIFIKNGEILIEQDEGVLSTSPYKVLTYNTIIKHSLQDWTVISSKATFEVPKKADKKGFIKIDVYEQRLKSEIPLKDFDIETVKLTKPKVVKTY